MRLGRCRYEVTGLAHGELWLRGTVLVHHDLVLLGVPGGDARRGPRGAGACLPDAAGRRAAAPAAAARERRTYSPQGGAEPPLRIEPENLSRGCVDLVEDVCRRFREHLLGRPVDYADVELALDGHTDLQQALARALRRVPWGEVVTYGELAAHAGRPGAARAAGAFCADSAWSLVVPAHRVVAAGGIGGFGAGGTAAKRHLLALEGVRFESGGRG